MSDLMSTNEFAWSCFKFGKAAVEKQVLWTVTGGAALSKAQIYRWFLTFKDGQPSVQEEQRTLLKNGLKY